jgi:uncharacterized membrane protein
MSGVTKSKNNIDIRLTDERWIHIVENHSEMAGFYFEVLEAIEMPDYVIEGHDDELWALKLISDLKAILVVYKEMPQDTDGFIITAFMTTKINKFLKRRVLWPPQP